MTPDEAEAILNWMAKNGTPEQKADVANRLHNLVPQVRNTLSDIGYTREQINAAMDGTAEVTISEDGTKALFVDDTGVTVVRTIEGGCSDD